MEKLITSIWVILETGKTKIDLK